MSEKNSSLVFVDVTKSYLPVWKYFKKSVDGSTAKCKLCNAVRKCKDGSPKGLKIHLKSIHNIDTTKNVNTEATVPTDGDGGSISGPITAHLSDTDTAVNSASSASTSVQRNLSSESDPISHQNQPTPSKKKKIGDYFSILDDKTKEKMVSKMVAKDGLPFRVFCTSDDLRSLFAAKGHNLPTSPNSIKSMVMDYGTTLKMKVHKDLMKLKDNGHRFTLTCDEWTSGRNRRYLNVNLHTNTNSQAVFWNLGLIRIFGSMPSEACIELLNNQLSEYGLTLDTDVVGTTTDGASVMMKVGKLIKPLHQLCYAHGIQLGISDVIYKKNTQIDLEEDLFSLEDITQEAELNAESDEGVEEDEVDDNGFRVSYPSRQVDLALEYRSIITKLRKLVKLFKNSPTKNDVLQTYIQEEFNKPLQLVLDCKTRWSSLANMISTYNRVKQCVSKTLIDLGYGSTSEYFFSDEEHGVLVSMQQAFEPIKLTVQALCRRDTDLASAEYALRFMIRELEQLQSPLSEKLAIAMRKRISERRMNSTATLLYLKNPAKYQEDLEKFAHDLTFRLPEKNIVRRDIKDLVKRLYRNVTHLIENEDDEEDLPLSDVLETRSLIPESELSVSLQKKLDQELMASQVKQPKVIGTDRMDALLKKEMNLYEYGGEMGQYLKFAYNSLLTIVPTSVEAERAFSAAGYLATDIRCRMADSTLSTLCFLRSYFQNMS